MKFLADENCDITVVRVLRAAGHDVTYIAESSPGDEDEDILALSLREQRVLLTEDLDFCELVFRDAKPAYAIVLIRILSANRTLKASRIVELVNTYDTNLIGKFVSLDVDDMRARPLPI